MTVVLRWKAKPWETEAKISCKLFGHIWRSGWWGDMPYLKKKGGHTDGIGRSHFTLHTRCDKCGTTSSVARIHGD